MRAPRILVAEDNTVNLELVQAYLEAKGYEVDAAMDGNRALELGGSGDYDLLILDIHMPLYGGVEVLHMLRKRFLQHPMKIIALTADVTPELREDLAREGIDSYLSKPVSLEGLGKEVRRLLDNDRPMGNARLP